ncbi:MAG TPA: MFS transporter, partial [Symbiobacteriaceae bacterium]|nr:MFS transporter [Symbiobacteriaceae bacterium]
MRIPARGLTGFNMLWVGQIISVLGTGMNRFALSIWAWQTTGSATLLAAVMFVSLGTSLLISPVAGVMVDRFSRKRLLILADLAAMCTSGSLLALHAAGRLEVWHLFVAGAFAGLFESLQAPAFQAAVTTMLPPELYSRANGRMALLVTLSDTFAPLLAGYLLAGAGLAGVLTVDLLSFAVSILTLLLVHIPTPAQRATPGEPFGRKLSAGFRYIFRRPGLVGMLLLLMAVNISVGTYQGLVRPFILSRTGDNVTLLASVLAAGGVGQVAGALLLSFWKGPAARIHGLLLGTVLASLRTVFTGLGDGPLLWYASAGLLGFFIPFVNTFGLSIWQALVEPEVQGQVFAARRMAGMSTAPVVTLLCGMLSDRVLEPAMGQGGALVPVFG